MATRNQHVQDTAVVERRLRPIYEWLDSGNAKKALQECEKVLRKTPDLQCAKGLKTLALLRLGKENDALGLLESLANEKPCDDATLQAMTLCYRELQQLDKISQLYKSAVELDPTNEELHTHLFMSYVRVFDFKAQQQSAMALYKMKPKNPYYCWAVMSIILQATRGEGKGDPKKRALLFSLAERMMDKLIGDNKLEAEQEVQLYIMILELQGKYEQILQILDGPLGTKLVCSTPPLNRLRYFLKLKRWNEVNILCKSILIDNVDKWDIWKEYMNSVFELMDTNTDHTNNHITEIGDNYLECVDDTPEKAHEFICRLVENGADNGYLLRGPYLARFELCSKLAEKNIDTTDLLGETTELFIEYFRKFGHKPCCVSDLRIYLSLLDGDRKAELAARLMKDIGISDTSVPNSEQQMQRHICALQLSRLCSSHRTLTPDHLKAVVTALTLHYQHGYQQFGTNVLSTDQGPADPYILLAAHVLYDVAHATATQEPLVRALVLLETLLKNSPSSFHAKLLCVRLYHELGGGVGAQKFYESLDVKHLQLDSLGWIHCARLPTTGLLKEAIGLYDTTLKFFSSNYKDSSDHLTFSYKFGSFFKLDEFMDFRERLNNSLHYTTIAVDRIILNLVQCNSLDTLYNIDTSPNDNKIEWDSLIDNHDLSVYVSWDPERTEAPPETSKEVKMLYEQDLAFLKLRTQILYATSAAVSVVKSTDGIREKGVAELKGVLQEWGELYTKISQDNPVPIRQNLLALPLPSRLHNHLLCPYYKIITNLFNLLLSLTTEDLKTSNAVLKTITETYTEMSNTIKEKITQSSTFWLKRDTMEFVVNCVEITCISVMVCLLCAEIGRPTHGNKKARKKNDVKTKDVVSELAVVLKENLQGLEGMLKEWTAPPMERDITDKLEMLNLNGAGYKDIKDNLVNSHESAVKELQGVLRSKLKLLSGL